MYCFNKSHNIIFLQINKNKFMLVYVFYTIFLKLLLRLAELANGRGASIIFLFDKYTGARVYERPLFAFLLFFLSHLSLRYSF